MANHVLEESVTGAAVRARRRYAGLAGTTLLSAGLLTAGMIATAGVAEARPNRDATGAQGRDITGAQGRDTTGAHANDPRGFHHTDRDPLRQREHQDARREYYRQQNESQRAGGTGGGSGGATAYTAVPRSDGDGWTVCPAQARWCR